ncbi:MAG: phosphoenolpyruvate carboxylase [Steroidobacteraceae bacterium]
MNRDQIHFPPRHNPLREDIHLMGDLLGQVLREQGGDLLFDVVELDRQSAIRRRAGTEGAGVQLAARVRGRPPQLARDLVRAFSAWFSLVNVAEKVHRIRRRREYFQQEEGKPQPGGVEDALAELKAQGLGLDDVLQLLGELSIEPVLTAHPTESTRRTTLRRQQRMARLVLDLGNPLLAPYERAALLERMRAEITTDWQSEEHPRERLNVADEREHAVYYLGEVFYQIVPAFYHEIATALAKLYGVGIETLQLPTLLRFGTWVGGDMDGNADVHAKTIRDTLLRQQQVIINNYFSECQALGQQLSQSASRVGISPELQQRSDDYRTLFPGAERVAPARHDRMPYRVFLAQVAERLRCTYDGRPNGYERPAQFRDDILLIANSLHAHHGVHAGLFRVRRLLTRIDTFKFHLATLDLRQRADVHHAVLAQGLADPQWTQRTPEERHARLVDILERDAGPAVSLDALGKRTLAVFDAMVQARHRYGAEAVGLYIIAGARQADDVLAPLVLARWAEAYDRRTGEVALDVAPQFDRVETLESCGATIKQLLEDSVYRRHLDSRGRLQTVLIGYSESGQQAGMVASRLAAYRAQRHLTEALSRAREDHVLFYARGGSAPRGGGRIDALLRAAPAESVSGVLRFTEQGESISQNYGLRPNAMRTLERAFSTLSLATLAVRRRIALTESQQLADCAQLMAKASSDAWRALVFEEPGFNEFFHAVTPMDVIMRMQIGASTLLRADRLGIETVRPSAWVFAWSQSRHMLPGWYGAGSGMKAVLEQRGLELLRRSYRGWPFFRLLIDDIEATLARSDTGISQHYDRLAPAALRPLAERIRAEHARCIELVLAVKESTALLDGDRTLQRSIELRNPYVDPMNLIQVDLLERWRAGGRQDRALFEALVASVGGIARGLQTNG